MPRSEQEIREYHKQSHDELSRVYYANPGEYPGGKAAFDTAHGLVWAAMANDLIQAGYLEPPPPTLEERLAALEARSYG